MREYTKEEKDHIKSVVEARLEGREINYNYNNKIGKADELLELMARPELYSIKPQTITCYMKRDSSGLIWVTDQKHCQSDVVNIKTWEEEVPES